MATKRTVSEPGKPLYRITAKPWVAIPDKDVLYEEHGGKCYRAMPTKQLFADSRDEAVVKCNILHEDDTTALVEVTRQRGFSEKQPIRWIYDDVNMTMKVVATFSKNKNTPTFEKVLAQEQTDGSVTAEVGGGLREDVGVELRCVPESGPSVDRLHADPDVPDGNQAPDDAPAAPSPEGETPF